MKNSDQPAHPINEEATDRVDAGVKIYTGLSKREEFARSAMQGMLANPTLNYGDDFQTITFKAIKCADELLKQLEQ